MHFKLSNTKKIITSISAFLIFMVCLWACNEPAASRVTYEVSIELTDTTAPPLQSLAHGVIGSDYLLFAGRTNKANSQIGGGADCFELDIKKTIRSRQRYNKRRY